MGKALQELNIRRKKNLTLYFKGFKGAGIKRWLIFKVRYLGMGDVFSSQPS